MHIGTGYRQKPSIDYIPGTTGDRVIFPKMLSEAYCFRKYVPEQTKNRVSVEQVETVLKEIETVYKPFAKRVNKAFLCFIVNFCLAIALSIPYFIYVSPLYKSALLPIGIVGVILWIFVPTIYCVVSVSIVNTGGREASEKVIEKYNRELKGLGVRWCLPEKFPKWIELWNDFLDRPEEYHQAIPTYGETHYLKEEKIVKQKFDSAV